MYSYWPGRQGGVHQASSTGLYLPEECCRGHRWDIVDKFAILFQGSHATNGYFFTFQVITMEKILASIGRYAVVQHNSKGFIKWEPARGRAHGYCRSESLWK